MRPNGRTSNYLDAKTGPCQDVLNRFVLLFVAGTFMALQSYAASRTWGLANPNTIPIETLSVIGSLFVLGLAIRGD